MKSSIHRLLVTAAVAVLVVVLSTACDLLFGDDGGTSSPDTDTQINGSIELNLEEDDEGATDISMSGALTATNFHLSTLDIEGSATIDNGLDEEPDKLTGSFTIDGSTDYEFEDVFAVGVRLEAAVFSLLENLGDETPDGFTVDGNLSELWDDGEVTVTFTEEHPTVEKDGTLKLEGSTNDQARLAIASEDLVVKDEPLGVDIVIVFPEIPSDGTEPEDFSGAISAFETEFDLATLMTLGDVFDTVGNVLGDLEDYFDDAVPNPYIDTEIYPTGITVTVDSDDAEGEPVPLPTKVTIQFTEFSPE